jgi:hypothetical protein
MGMTGATGAAGATGAMGITGGSGAIQYYAAPGIVGGNQNLVTDGSGNLTLGGDVNIPTNHTYRYNTQQAIAAITALYNWYFGYGAGSLAATGQQNTAGGYNALNSISSGGFNTAFGSGALKVVTTTDDNAAFGAFALNSCTGAYNVGVGEGAGSGATTGQQNTVVGQGSATSLVAGSYNTIIGSGTTCTANAQNQFALGYGVTTTADNTGVLGNAAVTNIYCGSMTAAANIHCANISSTNVQQVSIVLNSPGGASTAVPMVQLPMACHIVAVNVLLQGGTNIVGNLNTFTAAGGGSTAIAADITALAGTVNSQTPALAMTAGQWIGWHTTSTSGSPTFCAISIQYTVP